MVLKGKLSKIYVVSVLFLSILWLATPKVYIHKLLNHNHQMVKTNGETSIQTEANPDCNFNEYDSPVSFTILKSINNVILLNPKYETVLIILSHNYNSFEGDLGASRAPPIA